MSSSGVAGDPFRLGLRIVSDAGMSRENRAVLCTAAALCAFAGNSLLTRLALGRMTIDAATFTTVRLAAGAGMLLLVTRVRQGRTFRISGSWPSATVLFLYAVPFSYAYVSLTAGTGALILIGSVQVTMMIAALVAGERPHVLQWLGLSLALAGLVYLAVPGLAAPSLLGSISMALAGMRLGVLLAPRQERAESARTDHKQFRARAPSRHHRRRPIAVTPPCGSHRDPPGPCVWGAHIRSRVRALVRGSARPDGYTGCRGAVASPDSRRCRRDGISWRSHFTPTPVLCDRRA